MDTNNIIMSDDKTNEYVNELCENHVFNCLTDAKYNKVYYTDALNYENNIYSLNNIELNENIFIKLSGYGDYQISIYNVKKPNCSCLNRISENNQNMSFIPKTFEQMCNKLKLVARIYSKRDCENEIIIMNNTFHDIYNEPINIYEYMCKKIFNYEYSDLMNYKIIQNDGNSMIVVFEFLNNFYIIEYDTS
jgi:hypothetical protein